MAQVTGMTSHFRIDFYMPDKPGCHWIPCKECLGLKQYQGQVKLKV